MLKKKVMFPPAFKHVDPLDLGKQTFKLLLFLGAGETKTTNFFFVQSTFLTVSKTRKTWPKQWQKREGRLCVQVGSCGEILRSEDHSRTDVRG